MRRIAAVLAIILSLFGMPVGFLGGINWDSMLTSGVFWLALVSAAIWALMGRDLIYLAVAYGIFIGMNLASCLDVIEAMSARPSLQGSFGIVLAASVIAIGIAGLLLTLFANNKERTT
jgi:hypothetical protein